jgi:hypothetical protein
MTEEKKYWYYFWKTVHGHLSMEDYVQLPKDGIKEECESWAESGGGGFNSSYRYGHTRVKRPPLEWITKQLQYAKDNLCEIQTTIQLYQQMIDFDYTFRNKNNHIIKNKYDIAQSYQDILNPKDNYAYYLSLALEHFDNPRLRQIYFATAKVSLKKYHPFPHHYIEHEFSEKLTKSKLKDIIEKMKTEIIEEEKTKEFMRRQK